MPTPTEAEIQTQIANLVAILEEHRRYAAVNASGSISNFLTRENTFLATLETEFAAGATAGLASFRSNLNNAITPSVAAGMIASLLLEYAKFADFPETDSARILGRLYQRFIDNALRVKSRAFTFGTPTVSGSPAGNGTINRLNKDENNFDIENQFADAKVAQCVSDEHSGAVEHEEVFEFRSEAAEKDLLKITGSALITNIKALSAADSASLIRNPSFSEFTGTVSVPTAITNWTVGTAIGNFELDQTTANIYRGFNGDTTPTALVFKTNDSVEQNFSVGGFDLDPNVPMYCQIAFNRSIVACDGTLTLTMGLSSTSVVLAAQTGYNILRIDIGQKNWFKTFNQQNPKIKIALTGRTAGKLYVDDVIFAPYTKFDNSWYAVVGGSTPFLRNDKFTWADSIATDSQIQQWLWRAFNFFLPHSGTPTWADPI